MKVEYVKFATTSLKHSNQIYSLAAGIGEIDDIMNSGQRRFDRRLSKFNANIQSVSHQTLRTHCCGAGVLERKSHSLCNKKR